MKRRDAFLVVYVPHNITLVDPMADEQSSSLPQDAAKRLLELKKKILAGSGKSKPSGDVGDESKISVPSPQPSVAVEPEAKVTSKKQPLTMKSLMSSRRSSRRGSEEGTVASSAPAPVQSSPATQPAPSPTPFVSRLKEAPAHRTADAAGSKPKVISLTKTWVTTTQEREAKQAAADEAAVQQERIVKRPKIVKVKVEQQPVLMIPRDNKEKFIQGHCQWVRQIASELGLEQVVPPPVLADRSNLEAFISHHRNFIKSN